ncbi:MAG: hypothetical protein A2Y77_01125 [Planctomycetes bacterium RBG_13_62_9]|nr:MAG: hypothetical protein A2Y77_01125 [Planctomycetes bacterium RBG_13_62_9]
MWLRWFPWKFVIRRLARSHGFVDPITLLSYFRRFAQPSEVVVPIEILRAGVVFHARGLINSRVIQQNLDWIWPYWICRQFDPKTEAFIPRAFSLTHVNLTARNWTAVGTPGCDALPIVDPRGLVTPFWDGWSLDAWVAAADGRMLIPSRMAPVEQTLDMGEGLSVVTVSRSNSMELQSRVEVVAQPGIACRWTLRASCDSHARLVISARPYNPEGISFIDRIHLDDARIEWLINRRGRVVFSEPVQIHAVSDYRHGDVAAKLFNSQQEQGVACDVGMATAAAMFEIRGGEPREIVVRVPLEDQPKRGFVTSSVRVQTRGWRRQAELADDIPQYADATGKRTLAAATHDRPRMRGYWGAALTGLGLATGGAGAAGGRWDDDLRPACRLRIPDGHMQFLYEAALRMLILHCPNDVYPGPFTYKRFWFRDAAFILHAMLCAGLSRRAQHAIERFFPRQTAGGYFRSQEGEWDANGEVLWLLGRFYELMGREPERQWANSVLRAAHWIMKKRMLSREDSPCAGLLPAGFSAEHLGPNDYYYWDDFWSVAGLKSAAAMLSTVGRAKDAVPCDYAAADLMAAIERSLGQARARLGTCAMPASCHRRFDSGAIGSIVAGYPLQLFERQDERLLSTVEYLLDRCMVDGGFFQDMIHSGINVYLTLHLAQVLLRAGDARFADLVRAVAGFASPTGQWPEAIHPHTRGGCMGDGQHAWAAAEWVMMMRNCLLHEEAHPHRLVMGAGVLPEWLCTDNTMSIGPAPTSWGPVDLTIEVSGRTVHIRWQGQWFHERPEIEIRLPGTVPIVAADNQCDIGLENKGFAGRE